MGCAPSGYSKLNSGDPYIIRVDQAWNRAIKTCKTRTKKPPKMERADWKTVRIFVSSTFKDFHAEREILVKQVFPDLRQWCESRNLHLIDCDLRWGIPKDSTTEETLRICLKEIDRCFETNVWPFFVNMTCERIGWIPEANIVPQYIRDTYDWIDDLSVTEMEIIHAAYRIDNPNALFMFRDADFIKQLPADVRQEFTDIREESEADNQNFIQYKIKSLRDKVKSKFNHESICTYKVDYCGKDPETGKLEFSGLENFAKQVFEFFKKKIANQYPPISNVHLDPLTKKKQQHESFMKSRCEDVLGRDEILKQIENYLYKEGPDTPLLILGNAGSGKSSIMAKSVDQAIKHIASGQLKKHRGKDWNVFCHFVGAVPGSTDIDDILQRLIKEMTGQEVRDNERSNIVQITSSHLSNENTNPTLIIIDALNQLDEEDSAKYVTWLPAKLSPSIRIVLSMIGDTAQGKTLAAREPKPKEILIQELDETARKEIVSTMLGKYNKRLDDEQMNYLLRKSSSHNPLWLSIACEELRVFGSFREISNKINTLANGLLELEQQVLQRFEEENGGKLLVAAVCLIETSGMGLLEIELLSILSHDVFLEASLDKSEKECSEKKVNFSEKLPAYRWAEVYRALRPFIRPFGDSEDGRLDFYHRSLSKAVRKRYFYKEDGSENTDIFQWWHYVLTEYFKQTTNFHRQIEELPIHLIATKQTKHLEDFLSQWDVFEKLFDPLLSKKLLDYWRTGSSLRNMGAVYYNLGQNFKNSISEEKKDLEELSHKLEKLSIILAQGGEYDRAIEFSKEALEAAEKAGSDKLRLASLYHLLSYVLDEQLKLQEYMYRSQLGVMREIINNFEKAIDIWSESNKTDILHILGRCLNRVSFYYSGYALRGGDEHFSSTTATALAKERVEKAIGIFTKLGDRVMEGDCWTTKGVVLGRACSEQIKCYTTAIEMLTLAGGELNINLDRCYLNTAIYYEETGDYYKAYEYFQKWYHIGIALYGEVHPRNVRCINTLREPMYKRIALEKGDKVPQFPASEE
ncbi:DgyrCDS14011 [Dimorphilus gyrociliatus]|uniref:DgyrCDS14011 n=1 Tax=Dimorphilus gyrociliatus TaxID=2664684 RepID=A0A7I8WCA3_9ANNE|nr:DgyrCDS14011 [Dimorphilus gyrociliatus]